MWLPVRLKQPNALRAVFAAVLACMVLPTFSSVSAQSASATGSISVTVSKSASVSGPPVLQAGSTSSVDTLDGSFVDFFLDSGPITVFGTPSQAYSVFLAARSKRGDQSGRSGGRQFFLERRAVAALNQAGVGLFGIGGEIGVTGLSTAAGGEDAEGGQSNRPILTVSPYVNVVINYN